MNTLNEIGTFRLACAIIEKAISPFSGIEHPRNSKPTIEQIQKVYHYKQNFINYSPIFQSLIDCLYSGQGADPEKIRKQASKRVEKNYYIALGKEFI